MNGFWIFLIIAGVITTFARKEDKARRRGKGSENSQEDPKAEIERQLREMFGEEVIPQSTTQTSKSPISVTKAPTPKAARPTGTANISPKKHIAVATNNQESTADTASEKPKIAEIIDDFSMEKAVIYSEILKPKFEEY